VSVLRRGPVSPRGELEGVPVRSAPSEGKATSDDSRAMGLSGRPLPEFPIGCVQCWRSRLPRGDLVWLFDWMVGRVMEALESIDALESTAVVVTSDNGALPGDRVMAPGGRQSYRIWGRRSCGDWRGYKAHIWEGGHREPFVVSWPGVVEPGVTCTELVCLNDLLATAAGMAAAFRRQAAPRISRSALSTRSGPGRAEQPLRARARTDARAHRAPRHSSRPDAGEVATVADIRMLPATPNR